MKAADWARGARLDEARARPMTKPRNRRPQRRKPLDPARRAAFDVLRAVSERDAYANLVLPALLRERGITGRDAAFATELTYGTCRTLGLLDAVIAPRRGGRPTTSTRCCSTCCGWAPISCCAPASSARRRRHHRRTGGHRIRYGASGFRQRRAAHHRARDEQSWVERAGADAAAPTRSGTSRSCTPIPAGSRRRSPTRSAPEPVNSDALLASDDERPLVHLAARPGVLTAEELADAGRRDGRPLFAVRRVSAGGDPGQLQPMRDGRRWCRTRAASWWRGR